MDVTGKVTSVEDWNGQNYTCKKKGSIPIYAISSQRRMSLTLLTLHGFHWIPTCSFVTQINTWAFGKHLLETWVYCTSLLRAYYVSDPQLGVGESVLGFSDSLPKSEMLQFYHLVLNIFLNILFIHLESMLLEEQFENPLIMWTHRIRRR